jgi:hypothetical protein
MTAPAAVKVCSDIAYAQGAHRTSATVGADSTLSPEGRNTQGIVSWVDRSDGIALGYPRLTLGVRPPQKASRVTKVSVKLVLPTLEQTSASTMTGIQPAPTKAYDCSFIGEFFLPERSTQTERETLFSQVLSLFVDAIASTDGTPNDTTGSPLRNAVVHYEGVF